MKAFNHPVKVATNKGGQTTQPKSQPAKTVVDNRTSTVLQRKLQQSISASPRVLQAKFGQGLPAKLKANLENLSGLSLDGVQVHYNSSEPAKVGALAYAQGNDIYLGPGQETHLAHEAWHVVQQKQGRVRPTMQLEDGTAINDSINLELEADRMGQYSFSPSPLQSRINSVAIKRQASTGKPVLQRVVYPNMSAMWAAVAPDIDEQEIFRTVNQNQHLLAAYQDIAQHLQHMDFISINGNDPEAGIASTNVNGVAVYPIKYGPRNTQKMIKYTIKERFVGAILHEMMHITAAQQYSTNIDSGAENFSHFANMHLPLGVRTDDKEDDTCIPEYGGATLSQKDDDVLGQTMQEEIMAKNWDNFLDHVIEDENEFTIGQREYLIGRLDPINGIRYDGRVQYAKDIAASTHYETVLIDVIYYFITENLTHTKAYRYASEMLAEANARRHNRMNPSAIQELEKELEKEKDK